MTGEMVTVITVLITRGHSTAGARSTSRSEELHVASDDWNLALRRGAFAERFGPRSGDATAPFREGHPLAR